MTWPWSDTSMIHGLLPVLLAPGLVVIAWALWGARTPRGGRRCPKCGYDLRGQPAGRQRNCPECGHVAASDRDLHARRWRLRRKPLLLGLIWTLGILGAAVAYIGFGWRREQAILASIQSRHPQTHVLSVDYVYILPMRLLAYAPRDVLKFCTRVRLVHGQGDLDDADVQALQGLHEIGGLTLYQTQVTDTGLAALPRFTRVSVLEISGPGQITNAGLAHLAGMPNLLRLTLSQTGVTDAGLAFLTRLKNLQELSLEENAVTDAGLAHLAGLTKLERLYLPRTAVTGTGLAALPPSPNLIFLYLDYTPATDAGLAPITRFPNLQRLGLVGNKGVTDVGLKHLAGLSKLQELTLIWTRATPAGVAELQRQLPQTKITY